MPAVALYAPRCPLCGPANQCAASACGHFDVECWCRGVGFTEEVLAQVPADLKHKACLCRACAEPSHAHRAGQGQA
ncbi:MAG: cysteine-rich CWC family protein [Burkholderiales bacterium]|nr:cysteine-rich CWC family protein [Burkholderiales bacterium]